MRRGPTCQVECEGDEAVVASQELQRLLPLHQRPEVIGHCLPVEEVVDTNQEVPGGRKEEYASVSPVPRVDSAAAFQ